MHRDDSSANERSNKGNFLALLEVQINMGYELLKKHFQCTDEITAEVISGLILRKLEQRGLKIEDSRGQGYDGASNTPSQVRGV